MKLKLFYAVCSIIIIFALSVFFKDTNLISSLQGFSSLVTIFISILALSAIEVARQDISIRSERDAIVLALEYAKRFKDNVMGVASLQRLFNTPQYDENIIKNFTKSELKKLNCKNFNDYLKDFFEKNKKNNFQIEELLKIEPSLNELEIFSTAVLSKASDEKTLFPLCARTFCDIVERNFIFYCNSRENESDLFFKHTIELYKKWHLDVKKTSLINEIEKYSIDHSLEIKHLPALGVNI